MAKINFPKKQEQRLIPKYLLEYTEELVENHPDPTDPWGGSGGDTIEAGTGITITTESDDTKVISLDTNPDTFEVKADTGMTLEVENENPLWKDSKLQMTSAGSTRLEGTEISLEANNIYLNSNNAPFYVNNTTHEYKTLATTDQLFSGDYNDLYNKPTIPDAVSGTNDGTNWTSLTIGEDTYGLASGGSTYTAGTGIDITGTTISVDTNTVAMQTDIPTNYVTTDTTQNITGGKTFNNNITVNGNITVDNGGIISSPWYRTYNSYFTYDSNDNNNWTSYNNHTITQELNGGTYTILLPNANGTMALTSDIPTDLSDLNNDVGYITGITSSDVTTALGYTPGTSNFSGSYTDLTDKPTIPTATSQLTNDSGFITSADLPTNYVTTNTTQTITGQKTIGKTSGGSTHWIIENYSGVGYNQLKFNSNIGDISFYNDGNNFKTQVYEDSSHYYYIKYPRGAYFSYYDNTYTFPLTVNGTKANANTGDISIAIPSKTSDLTNDSGFVTSSDLSDYVTEDEFIFDASSFSDGDTLTEQEALDALNSMHIKYNNNIYTKINDTSISSSVKTWNYCYLANLTTGKYANEYIINISTSSPYTIHISNESYKIPEATSDLTNDSGFITNTVNNLTNYTLSSSLATVATSGSYNDLTNKPTIPTTATSTVTASTDTVVSGVTGSTTTVVSGVTYTPATETLVFTYTDNTTATITLLTSGTTVTSATTTVLDSVSSSTATVMTGATVTTTLS